MASGETEICEVAGVKTDVLTIGAGTPLLLLHSGDAREIGAPFVQHLAKHHQVIIPTHPGFRNSALPPHFTDVNDLAYFYLDFMRARALSNVALVGMSFGGWIAAEIAIRSTARLRSLVLVDAFGIKVGGREARDIADFFGMPAAKLNELAFRDGSLAEVDTDNLSEDETTAIVRNREALAYYGWKPYMHNPALAGWLHRIDIPTLVVWGDSDRIVSPDYGRHYAKLIPDARFEIVPRAAHYPHLESPAQFVEVLEGFLAKQRDKQAA